MVLSLWGCTYDSVRMPGFSVHGIDISHYQSHIDWSEVALNGVHFAFIKATEGATFTDTMFCRNWAALKEQNIRRGAYHFYRPGVSAEAQVANFAAQVELSYGDLPPVLDVEVVDERMSKVELIRDIRYWLYLIEIKYNIKPILYTNAKFYNRYLAGQFNEYPLWIARYNNYREPRLACGRKWDFWQYGDRGRIPGIDGPVDLNVFRGELHELDALCLFPSHNISQR